MHDPLANFAESIDHYRDRMELSFCYVFARNLWDQLAGDVG